MNEIKIEHVAVWADDLETMREFYVQYFGLSCGEKYTNHKKGFTCYFLVFGTGKTRLEIMNMGGIGANESTRGFLKGLAHFAISVGNKDAVDRLTERLRADGFTIAGEPRTTGDGYYESVVLDPEGNRVEITA